METRVIIKIYYVHGCGTINTPFGVVVSLVVEESECVHSLTPGRLRRVERIEKPVALQQEKENTASVSAYNYIYQCLSVSIDLYTYSWLCPCVCAYVTETEAACARS